MRLEYTSLESPVTTRAWAFTSQLSLEAMKPCLEAASGGAWRDGDSAWHGDYLGGRLSEYSVARIYEVDAGYVVHLRFHCPHADALERLSADQMRLLEVVLPAAQAKNVRMTEPVD